MIGLAAVLLYIALNVAGALVAHRVKYGRWNHSVKS